VYLYLIPGTFTLRDTLGITDPHELVMLRAVAVEAHERGFPARAHGRELTHAATASYRQKQALTIEQRLKW
jgi:hypothetical protein